MTSTDRGAAPAPVVELRSDTFTLPTPRMLAEMTRAPLGDDVYGEDPTARELEELAARLLGMEDACFMPSGTMGNLAALLAHCPRGTKALAGAESDIYVYEAGGASYCGGVIVEPVPNRTDGTMALADLEAGFPEDPEDPQFALPAVLCVENPQNRCGGGYCHWSTWRRSGRWPVPAGWRCIWTGPVSSTPHSFSVCRCTSSPVTRTRCSSVCRRGCPRRSARWSRAARSSSGRSGASARCSAAACGRPGCWPRPGWSRCAR